MKKKRLICLVTAIVVFISAFAFYNYIDNYNIHTPNNQLISAPFYPTVHDAMENELNTKIYKAIESNGTCLAVCDGTADGNICQYLYNSEAGWQIITKAVCENPLSDGYNDKCRFKVYDYMNKYIVCVSQNVLSKEAYGKTTVTDSLNSSFVNLNYKSGEIYDTDYWYVCLDAIPEDYTIYINGEPAFTPLKISFAEKIAAILNK